jgi:Ser/Thr protein kinase RdoA (MazF antagonist)
VTGYEALEEVLAESGVRAAHLTVLKDLPYGNRSWLVDTPAGERLVLRGYHDRATEEDLLYEHAVLAHLDGRGWLVPSPVADPVHREGLWYCLTRFVGGAARTSESVEQRRRRGQDLARLHLGLRGLDATLGQRPGWRAQHTASTVHTDIDFAASLAEFGSSHPALAEHVGAAAEDAQRRLDAIGAAALPTMVVHGDFHEGNVHYHDNRLVGVIDFGLTHLDSRPYELAIARTYRAPEAADAYRDELARVGWPLSPLEIDAIGPVSRAFRVDMIAWQLDHGARCGAYNIAMIEQQLARIAALTET